MRPRGPSRWPCDGRPARDAAVPGDGHSVRRLGHRRPRRCACRARRAMDAGRAEVVACERALSRFDPDSDLMRLNGAGGGWVTVGERLLAALRAALQARDGHRRPLRPDHPARARRRRLRPLVRAADAPRPARRALVARWGADRARRRGRARPRRGGRRGRSGRHRQGLLGRARARGDAGRVARAFRRSGRSGRRHRRLGHVARGGALAARRRRPARAGRVARHASHRRRAASPRRAVTGAGSASRASSTT